MPVTVTLKTPISLQTTSGKVVEEISALQLYPLKAGDFLSAMDAAGADKVGTLLGHLAARSSRLSFKQIQSLEADDLFAVINEVQRFFPNGLQIGQIVLNSSAEPSDTPPTSQNGDQDN